jgi:hypothetical protein
VACVSGACVLTNIATVQLYTYDQVGNLMTQERCSPTDCASQQKSCGFVSDGCRGTVFCGTCPTGKTCSSTNTCL